MAGELVTLIVSPHPDDETIGAGIRIHRYRQTTTVLQLTDGSPRDLRYAHESGFPSRLAYAEGRRAELLCALSKAGFGEAQLQTFGYIDQELHLHVQELVDRLTGFINNLRPDIVLSPAYEGGHPDHDTAAFALASARKRTWPFLHREFRLYHAHFESPDGFDATMDTRDFLPHHRCPVEEQILTPYEQLIKREMFAAFSSQSHLLKNFSVGQERFRDAPTYDFRLPPHDGLLLYERWGFAVSGQDWRDCVARSL